jgi:hypothetical protein
MRGNERKGSAIKQNKNLGKKLKSINLYWITKFEG